MNRKVALPYMNPKVKLSPFVQLTFINKNRYNPLQRSKIIKPYLDPFLRSRGSQTINSKSLVLNTRRNKNYNEKLKKINWLMFKRSRLSQGSVKNFNKIISTQTVFTNYNKASSNYRKPDIRRIQETDKKEQIKEDRFYWIIKKDAKTITRYSSTLKPILCKRFLSNKRASEAPKQSYNTNVKKPLRAILKAIIRRRDNTLPTNTATQPHNIEEEKTIPRLVVENTVNNEVVEDNISERSTIVEHYNQDAADQNIEQISTEEEV